MTDIIVVGSFVVGMTVRLPRMPYPGETLVADLFDLGVGGKGTDLAVAAARQGKQVAIIARVGDDDFAAMAYDLYVQEGIDSSGVVRTPGEKTAIGLVYLQPNGENTIGFYRGANWRLTPADIEPHIARHQAARVLATQLEIPDDTVAAAVRHGRQQGLRVILNPAPARSLPAAILRDVDILTPNEGEARVLAGLPVNDEATAIVEVARTLLAQGPRAVIVTWARVAVSWWSRAPNPWRSLLIPSSRWTPWARAMPSTAGWPRRWRREALAAGYRRRCLPRTAASPGGGH